MPVTDCHVHINPLWEMLPAARAIVSQKGAAHDLEQYLRSPRLFLEYLDRCGVDRAVLVNYVSPDVVGYTERTNDFVAEYVREDPARLVAIGSVLPSSADPGGEVDRLVDRLGIRGLKIHPSHQLFAPNEYIDRPESGARAIYAAAERHRIPVIVHTGTSVFPGARDRFAQPMLVEDVAIDFPNLTLVLAHGGRPFWTEEAMFLARRFPNVYLDVSSLPPARIPQYFPGLQRISQKVLFGSDWPGPGVTDIRANLEEFRALPYPSDVKERILSENPEKVFPRGTPK